MNADTVEKGRTSINSRIRINHMNDTRKIVASLLMVVLVVMEVSREEQLQTFAIVTLSVPASKKKWQCHECDV